MEKTHKKPTVTRISNVLNWARQNFQRLDDTVDALIRLERNPPKRSLRPILQICAEIANREIGLEEALERVAGYDSYLRMAADQILPEFHQYAQERQIIATREFDVEKYSFQLGKFPDGSSNYTRIEPTYFSIEGDKVVPTFVIGWTKVPFDNYKKRLSSSLIARALLSHQDFINSDARILTFARSKWSATQRERGGWRVSQYSDMTDEELQACLDRYDKALAQVLNLLREE